MGITDLLVQIDQDDDHVWRNVDVVPSGENVVWSPTQDKNCESKHGCKEFTAMTTEKK